MSTHKTDQSLFTQQAGLHQELGSKPASVPPQASGSVSPQTPGSATPNLQDSNSTAQSTTAVSPTASGTEPVAVPKKPKIALKTLLIMVPIGILLILFIAVQIKNSRGPSLPTAVTTTPATVDPGSKVDRSPIQQRLDTLKTELKQAEPTQQEFSFPPIDGSISLEEKR